MSANIDILKTLVRVAFNRAEDKMTHVDIGKRIIVIGSSGSGKSTLASELGKITGVPIIHIDRLLWNPGWIQTPKEEYDRRVIEVASGESWIIDGNNSSTLPFRIERADSIIFIDFNRYLCIFRVIKRRIKNHGKSRACMSEGCPEKIDLPFLKWVWNYPTHSRVNILEKIYSSDKPVYHLKTRKEVSLFIRKAKSAANYPAQE